MGQISPLDQLISNSAFNNCSVTVIYSGVIITDVLLLCDWPVAPNPHPHRSVPTWSCFMGLLQPLLLWCFSIFVVSSSAKCKFASVASLWDTSYCVSWPTGLSNLVWETIAYPSAHTSISPACPNQIITYLQPVMLPLFIKISRCLYYM